MSLTARGRDPVDRVTEYRRRETAVIVNRVPPVGRCGGTVDAPPVFTRAGGEPPAQTSPYDAGLTRWD